MKCGICPEGEYHDGLKCVIINCPPTFTFDVLHRRCVCPWYQPKLENSKCVPCLQGQIYNNNTRNC